MTYFKVKPEYDNKRIATESAHSRLPYSFWIGNELYTACELNAMKKKGYIVKLGMFDTVNINRNKTYWSFGARFECKD